MESLTKFSTSDEYKLTSNFPNAASIVEDESMRYLIKGANFVAGDIVLWNGTQKVVVAQENYSTTVFPKEKFTPIGVVVIPETHMYDGRARMMSTRWMSCDDPENGSITISGMVWGTATDLTGLTNFTEVPVIARYDNDDQGGTIPLTNPQSIYGKYEYAFLPSTYPTWTGETNPEDPGTKWYQTGTYLENSSVEAYNIYAPSPYASNGTPNPLYRATSYSGGSINNALSYFNGRYQTDVILAARGTKDYGSWKPTSDTPEDFPAASVCDMYHTVGTSQGDWYLPSQAELGYFIARLGDIGNALLKIGGLQESTLNYWIWSSCEYNTTHANSTNYGNGQVLQNHSKSSESNGALAFSFI